MLYKVQCISLMLSLILLFCIFLKSLTVASRSFRPTCRSSFALACLRFIFHLAYFLLSLCSAPAPPFGDLNASRCDIFHIARSNPTASRRPLTRTCGPRLHGPDCNLLVSRPSPPSSNPSTVACAGSVVCRYWSIIRILLRRQQ